MDDMADGELVVKCPACPRPGVNLPDGWERHVLKYVGLYLQVPAIELNCMIGTFCIGRFPAVMGTSNSNIAINPAA